MSRKRDAALAISLFATVVLLAIGVDASTKLTWLLAGVAATVLLEVVAYRRPTFVREQFERRPIVAGSLLLAGAGIAVVTKLAPDRALSLAAGAVGTYLCLLTFVEVTGWSPAEGRES